MKQRQLFQKPMLLLSLLFTTSLGFTQANQAWVRSFEGPNSGEDIYVSQVVDAAGNVYVAGTNEDNDYATVKYNAAGNLLWQRTYDGPNSYDDPTALAVDGAGNVYVTGKSEGSVIGSGFDYVTIKYDAAGNELWVRRYDDAEVDFPTAIAVDASGNVYITGKSGDVSFDYLTLKYSTAGAQRWVKRYNGVGNYDDVANDIAIDAAGNVYVTGYSTGRSTTGRDYATIKYNTNGTELWLRQYHYSGSDEATSLAVDASGNVYVTGASSGDYATIKYNSTGDGLWVTRYSGPGNGVDGANDITIDAAGNVYVTGYSTGNGTDRDYATIKYSTNGAELRVRRYNSAANSSDEAKSVAVDASGNVYVTGTSNGGGRTGIDFATIRYDAAGSQRWVKRYNGFGMESNDYAAFAAVDVSGDVYVTGLSYGNNDGDFYTYSTTVKYDQTEAGAVSSFTLINADSDAAIRELKDGDTLNLAALPSLNFNIRANTNPDTVGSVVFTLSGAASRNYTESTVPYALFADNNNGDYYGWTPANGNYTLTATPYSAAKGTGQKGTPLTIHFYVIYQEVSSFTLVNADTDHDITILRSGDVIDLSKLTTNNLNIRANTAPGAVGSVVFNLSGQQARKQTENIVPYALFADNNNGNYYAWTPQVGNYLLTATPYEQTKGRGNQGAAYTIAFSIISGSSNFVTTTSAAKPQQVLVADANAAKSSLNATPNPFVGQTTIRFSVPRSGYTSLELYDVKGVALERLYQAQVEAGKVYSVRFNSKQLPSGIYMLRTITGNQVQSYKLVLIR